MHSLSVNFILLLFFDTMQLFYTTAAVVAASGDHSWQSRELARLIDRHRRSGHMVKPFISTAAVAYPNMHINNRTRTELLVNWWKEEIN